MQPNRPWTTQDVQDFFSLVSYTQAPLVIEPRGSLVRLLYKNEIAAIEEIIGDPSALGTTENERYTNYLDKVKDTSFGKWLFKHDDFRQAYRLFKKKHSAARNSVYHIEWAELRFLQCAAIVGFFVNYRNDGNRRPSPTSRQVDQATTRITNLQKSLAHGVRFKEYEKTKQLTTLLSELLETLKSAERKPRADRTSVERQFVALLSSQLLENFGEVSPEIVIHLAAVMGYSVHETAIQAQIRKARKKHQESKRVSR